jgi:AraC-like DNA-binding protein
MKHDASRLPALTPGSLRAQRHGCTPRFIERLFEQEGTTFTGYVLAQRLARAHGLLSDPRRGAEKISEVAHLRGRRPVVAAKRPIEMRDVAEAAIERAQALHDGVTSHRRDN